MRCDGCDALRWYGLPLHREKALCWPGPHERLIWLSEVCNEERTAALWPETRPAYVPKMHPPHRLKQ